MSKNKCPKCGEEFKLSLSDKTMRKIVQVNAKLFPVLEDVCKEAENFCNDCYKEKIKPLAMNLAGVQPKNEK